MGDTENKPDRSEPPQPPPADACPAPDVAVPPPSPGFTTSRCPICFSMMFGAHCKMVCPNCGYKEDCSDLFPPLA